jgi:hypothetical protein
MLRTFKKCTVIGVIAVALAALMAAPASAESSTGTSAMTPNFTAEARVWKDAGVGHPTSWSTSTWAFHGAALQSMTTISDTTTITSTGGNITVSCTAGSDTKSCTGNLGTWSSQKTLSWINGNSYVADLSGQVNPEWTVFWLRICNQGDAKSTTLKIHGSPSTCVG